MKKKLIIILIGLCSVITILGVRMVGRQLQKEDKGENISVSTEEVKVTRAVAAKMISLLVSTREGINQMERVITYTDTDKTKWYDKYINAMVQLQIVMGEQESASYQPMEFLSYKDCKQAVIKLRGEEVYAQIIEGLSFKLEEKIETEAISSKEWLEIYRKLMVDGVNQSAEENSLVEEKTLFLLGTKESDAKMKTWQVITNHGDYYFDGFALDTMTDVNVKVITKGNDIIYVYGEDQEETVLHNVWIMESKDKEITAFVNGMKKTFPVENALAEQVTQVVGDLSIGNKMVTKVSVKPDRINGKVLVAEDGFVEIEGYGRMEVAENYNIYSIYNDVSSESIKDILVGYNTTDFVIAEGKICASLIKGLVTAENIRVAIKTEQFKDYYHEAVKVTSNNPFSITYGEQKKEYAAGEVVELVASSEQLVGGRAKIVGSGDNPRIQLLSLKRNGVQPSYRGSVEVASVEKGLVVINELSLEEYLYSVIPSEMPVSYGLEALKVQAVCARSYAYKQILSNTLSNIGAHVDDSVSYQVYNNTAETPVSIQAVEDTRGKVLKYKDEVATTYYFSTSCGNTTSAEEVWLSSTAVEYLQGELQVAEGTAITFESDFTIEENFRKFLTSDLCKTYDSDYAWYRWHTSISTENLRKSLEASITARYKVNPALIQTKMEDGTFKSVPIEGIGDINEIQIAERKTGGIVTALILVGTQKTIKVITEYNIRLLLAPIQDTIVRKDDSVVKSLSMLPSAFFVIDVKEKDGKRNFLFTGGGYGHGVGMSQNGVKTMAESGESCDNILQHYYNNATIGKIY